MAADSRPNILLITTDQQRADTVGFHGSRQARTPNLDRLADSGVVFDRAFVQNPVCIPSRACMQTGRYTHQHGLRYMEQVIDTTPGLAAHEITIMERLQRAGYATGATGKIHMMPERGFDYLEIVGGKGQRWVRSKGMEIGPAPLGKSYADWVEAQHPGGYEKIYEQRRRPEYEEFMGAIVNVLPLEQYVETYILEKSIEFMRRDHDRPFFLWCGFCGPHGPHDPPASHADLYPFDEIIMPERLETELNDRPPHLRRRPNQKMLTKEGRTMLRRFMSYYYCLATLLDEYVGKLVSVMEEDGLLDNTLIIYTSDHGEMLGDFRMAGKGNFYEPVLRVPMYARPPGGCRGRHTDGLTEVMDLAPTILDYAGIEKPREMQATSFRPALEGGDWGHDAILCEYTHADQKKNGKCLRTRRYKYVLWDTEQGGEFYDLQEDPLELRNRYYDPACREERDRHAEMLLAHLMQSEVAYNDFRTEPY